MDEGVVVIDSGSGFIKAGLHTETEPAVVAPQLVGRPRHRRLDSMERETFVGISAATMSGICTLSSPSERGFVVDFDDQCLIFEDVLMRQLRVDPRNHALLLSQPPIAHRSNEKRLTGEVFERFCIPALVKKTDSVLSLMDAGMVTGVVADCGDAVSHTCAVYEGNVLLNTSHRLELGGMDVTERLSRIVARETGFRAATRSEMRHVSKIKEGLHGLKEMLGKRKRRPFKRKSSVNYILPDGQKIQVDGDSVSKLYTAADILLEPSLGGVQSDGLHEMLISTLTNSPSVLHDSLVQNVILCGGSSLLSGLKEMLEAEVIDCLSLYLDMHMPCNPQLSVWRGGAILASLSTFPAMSITREEYFEEGPSRVEHKFI